jgi:hypothetical protein
LTFGTLDELQLLAGLWPFELRRWRRLPTEGRLEMRNQTPRRPGEVEQVIQGAARLLR